MAILTDRKLNQTDIQLAINQLTTTGGKVVLGPGTFEISTRIVLPSNVTLEGAGSSTIIKAAANFGEDIGTNPIYGEEGEAMIVNTYVGSNTTAYSTLDSNILIKNLKLDGNGANQSRKVFGIAFQYVQTPRIENVDCEDFGTLNTSPAVQTTEALGNKESISILLRNCLDPVVKTSRQEDTDGIGLVLCKRAVVNDIIGLGGTSEVIYISSCQGVVVDSVRTLSSESCGVFVENAHSALGGLSRDIIINNVLVDTTVGAATYSGFYCPGIAVTDTVRATLTNCKVSSAFGTGIDLYNVDDFIVESCTLYNNNTGNTGVSYSNIAISNTALGTATTRGIFKNCILYDDRTTERIKYQISIAGHSVEGVTIEGCKLKNATSDGIYVSSTTNNRIDILNCDITSMSGHGIHLSSSMKKCRIADCTIYSNASSGIRVGGLTYSDIVGNLCFNNGQVSGHGILLEGTTTHNLVDGNLCFDDQGSATQITGITEGSSCNRNVFSNNKLFGNLTSNFGADNDSAQLSERYNNPGMEARYVRRFLRYYNASGGSRARGEPVIYKGESNGEQFTVDTVAGDQRYLGVVAETIASTAFGLVQIEGRFPNALADATAAIVAGDLLTMTGTGNRLKKFSAGETACGYALEALAAGTGAIDVYLISPRMV